MCHSLCGKNYQLSILTVTIRRCQYPILRGGKMSTPAHKFDGDRAAGVWLVVETVAEILNVHARTVRRMAEAGDLVGVKFRGCLRIEQKSVEAYVERSVDKFRRDNGIF